MNIKRGDVVLAWYPFASGVGAKRRPCVIVQNDADNLKLTNTIVIQVTSILKRRGDKSHVFVEVGTPDGKQTGLLSDSLISCNNLATIEQQLIDKVIGSLTSQLMQQMDASLKAALALP